MTEADSIIICRDVHKWYGQFHVLRGISLEVRRGEVVVIFGPSGSGKSTFIRTLNRLEEHQRGQIIVDGVELTHDLRNIERVRAEAGMVFQSFALFPHLSVLDNITLAPIWVRHRERKEAETQAMELLERVGMPEQARKYPGQLSGGQQQRIAVARALIGDPALILADEPTGNLDSETADAVLSLIAHVAQARGATVLIATHDPGIASRCDRVVSLRDGVVVSDTATAESVPGQ